MMQKSDPDINGFAPYTASWEKVKKINNDILQIVVSEISIRLPMESFFLELLAMIDGKLDFDETQKGANYINLPSVKM